MTYLFGRAVRSSTCATFLACAAFVACGQGASPEQIGQSASALEAAAGAEATTETGGSGGSPAGDSAGTAGSGGTESTVGRDLLDDLEKFMEGRVAAPANLESASLTSVVYLLRNDPTCTGLGGDSVVSNCERVVSGVPLRVRVTPGLSATTYELLTGSDMTVTGTIVVGTDRVTADIPKEQLKTALEAIGALIDK